jgi:hypothetical protein
MPWPLTRIWLTCIASGAGDNAVKRFVGRPRRSDSEPFGRLAFAPGEEAQIDAGEDALPRDHKTGMCATASALIQ